METAIYVRVSTEEQAQEGFSIRGQQQKLKDYANVKDWSIFNVYSDEGISGKNIKDRPAMTKMIEDIQNGYIQNVVVFKIDRLTRSTADLVYLIDLFKQHNCAFNSLMESIDTYTASGRMFLKIIGIFAEFERENIIERVKLGCERKAKEGYSVSAWISSYGYDRENGQKVQTINPEEAEIVKEIFDMYVNQNISLNGIASRLNMRKIPTKKNAVWERKNIKNILTNCNYIGKVRYAIDDKQRYFEADGMHEPIIWNELFEQAQKLLTRNVSTNSTKKPKEENYFLGIVVCAKCGKKLGSHNRYKETPQGNTQFVGAYRCPNRSVKHCDAGSMTHAKVEKAFKEYVSSITPFDVNDEIYIDEQEKVKKNHVKLIEEYQSKLNQLKSKEKESLGLYVNNNIEFVAYRDIKERIDKERNFILSELSNLASEEEEVVINEQDIILDLKENWEFLNNVEKRQFLLRFVKRIDIVKELENEKDPNARKSNVIIKHIEFQNF